MKKLVLFLFLNEEIVLEKMMLNQSKYSNKQNHMSNIRQKVFPNNNTEIDFKKNKVEVYQPLF